MAETVWVVVQDQDAHNTVLGIFGCEAEASAFADEVSGRFDGNVLYFSWVIGRRYDEGSRHATFRG